MSVPMTWAPKWAQATSRLPVHIDTNEHTLMNECPQIKLYKKKLHVPRRESVWIIKQ